MKHGPILILLFLLALTFRPVLFNGFVGDDQVFLVNNTFYTSWQNLTRLVQPEHYQTKEAVFYSHAAVDRGSGSVSTRPSVIFKRP